MSEDCLYHEGTTCLRNLCDTCHGEIDALRSALAAEREAHAETRKARDLFLAQSEQRGAAYDIADDLRSAAESRLTAALDALRRFEWQSDESGYVMCPECYQTKGTPHLDNCQIRAALAGGGNG